MFAVERQRVIRRYIEEHHQADVHELSILLNISEVTVRRDLERLESEGHIERTHGGAVIREDWENPGEIGSPSANDLNSAIAATALLMVPDGDTILLSSGILPRLIARRLGERAGCTVLTNDLAVAQSLASQSQNRCVFLGGDLNVEDGACYGGPALEELRHFHVQHFFCEIDGLGGSFSLSVHSRQKAQFIQQGRSQAAEFSVLCPGHRLLKPAFFHLGELNTGDSLVTDRTIETELKKAFFLANIRLHIAQELVHGGNAQ